MLGQKSIFMNRTNVRCSQVRMTCIGILEVILVLLFVDSQVRVDMDNPQERNIRPRGETKRISVKSNRQSSFFRIRYLWRRMNDTSSHLDIARCVCEWNSRKLSRSLCVGKVGKSLSWQLTQSGNIAMRNRRKVTQCCPISLNCRSCLFGEWDDFAPDNYRLL